MLKICQLEYLIIKVEYIIVQKEQKKKNSFHENNFLPLNFFKWKNYFTQLFHYQKLSFPVLQINE